MFLAAMHNLDNGSEIGATTDFIAVEMMSLAEKGTLSCSVSAAGTGSALAMGRMIGAVEPVLNAAFGGCLLMCGIRL